MHCGYIFFHAHPNAHAFLEWMGSNRCEYDMRSWLQDTSWHGLSGPSVRYVESTTGRQPQGVLGFVESWGPKGNELSDKRIVYKWKRQYVSIYANFSMVRHNPRFLCSLVFRVLSSSMAPSTPVAEMLSIPAWASAICLSLYMICVTHLPSYQRRGSCEGWNKLTWLRGWRWFQSLPRQPSFCSFSEGW